MHTGHQNKPDSYCLWNGILPWEQMRAIIYTQTIFNWRLAFHCQISTPKVVTDFFPSGLFSTGTCQSVLVVVVSSDQAGCSIVHRKWFSIIREFCLSRGFCSSHSSCGCLCSVIWKRGKQIFWSRKKLKGCWRAGWRVWLTILLLRIYRKYDASHFWLD